MYAPAPTPLAIPPDLPDDEQLAQWDRSDWWDRHVMEADDLSAADRVNFGLDARS